MTMALTDLYGTPYAEEMSASGHKCEVLTVSGNVCCLGQTGYTAAITNRRV